jgi:hypothetical protein
MSQFSPPLKQKFFWGRGGLITPFLYDYIFNQSFNYLMIILVKPIIKYYFKKYKLIIIIAQIINKIVNT